MFIVTTEPMEKGQQACRTIWSTKKILIRNAELLKKESENEKKLFCLCEKVFQSKQYVQKLDPCIFLSETVYNV